MALSGSIYVEADTVKVADVSSRYFRQEPVDSNYTMTEFQPFPPQTTLQDDLTFVLPPLDGPMQYVLSETIIAFKIKLTKENGRDKPDAQDWVGLKVIFLHIIWYYKA